MDLISNSAVIIRLNRGSPLDQTRESSDVAGLRLLGSILRNRKMDV